MAFLDKNGLQRFWEIILSKFATKEEISDHVAKEELNGYVAKEEGKGLSSNDFTDEEKEKLAGIEVGDSPAIIDVVELPETGIDDDSFYRRLSGQVYYNGTPQNDMTCYIVETLPSVGVPVTTDMVHITLYYAVDTGAVSGYLPDALGGQIDVPAGWYPVEVLAQAFGMEWGGIISDASQDPIDDANRLLLKYDVYHYAQGWVNLSDKVGWRSPEGTGAEVFNSLTNKATGNISHAEGYSTTAAGESSHAEGRDTTASGNYSHAEGNGNTASGFCSHAEGGTTTASGHFSHTEGVNSHAEGYASHAEGYNTNAEGDYSHAEGCHTGSSCAYTHTEGYQTIADCNFQHVQGKNNIRDYGGKYAHIVGNGEGDSNRSNAYTLDWSGNGWFAGGIKVGGTGQDDEAAVSVLLSNDMTEITNAQIDEICGATIVSGSEVNL